MNYEIFDKALAVMKKLFNSSIFYQMVSTEGYQIYFETWYYILKICDMDIKITNLKDDQLMFLLIDKLKEEIDNLKSEIEIIKNRLTPTDSKVENNKTYVYGDSGSINHKSGDLGKIDAELTLGNYLKSSRLGYRWSSEHKAFIRMSLIKDKIYVSVAPPKQLPSRIIKKYDKYICWWESNDINEILNDCKPLKNIYNPQIRQDFITDYDGFYLRDFDISKKFQRQNKS